MEFNNGIPGIRVIVQIDESILNEEEVKDLTRRGRISILSYMFANLIYYMLFTPPKIYLIAHKGLKAILDEVRTVSIENNKEDREAVFKDFIDTLDLD